MQEVVPAGKSVSTDTLRVVSLAPNITEVIYALNCGDLLVGRTDYCNYPPEVNDVISVGSITQPSIETIIELSPDIVIASTHGPKEAAEMLMNAGIDVKYYYGPETFEGVYEVISMVGADLHAEDNASRIIKEMDVRYRELKGRAGLLRNKPSVYYAIGFGEGGDWTAGGDTFISQMIDVAGGKNIASEVSGWSYSLEKIVEADPDIILVSSGLRDVFVQTPVYSDLTAVKNGRVYGIDEDTIARQGPRLIEGIEQLNEIFSE
jgi:iron complex transport system substrate-binding protein